jgi:hypothetical protein
MAYINVEIDVDDFMDELSISEKDDIIEWLKKDGLKADVNISVGDQLTASQTIILENLVNIKNNIWRLTDEDAEIIKTINNKL